MAAKNDYYDILGVTKDASQADIKSAYRKKATEWHPDKHKNNKEEAEKRFKEINEAYQVLSDTQKRKAYDQFGHAAFSPGGGRGKGPFSYTYTQGSGNPFSGFDFGDPFEIFEQFFGGSSPFREARIPRYSITIEFMEAVKGVEKEVILDGKKRSIKIPAGIDEGQQIRFSDFILSVNIKPHDIFERNGSDIYVQKQIPFSLAALGGTVEVPTIDKNVKIKVRKGTPSGTLIRLRGKGVKRLRSFGRGDQYVKLVVEVPQSISKRQRSLIKSLQKEGL